MNPSTTAAADRCGAESQRSGLWTRRRCARGHLVEHPGAVTIADLGECWCGAPGQAATVYLVKGESHKS